MDVTPHSAEDRNLSRMKRRRLEAEIMVYDADRTKLLRRKEEAQIQKRLIEKEIAAQNSLLVQKQEEERKIAQDIQTTNNELLRLRKAINSL
jgi:RNase adaptor protein for sRNA GlmZ degradation